MLISLSQQNKTARCEDMANKDDEDAAQQLGIVG